MIRSHADQPATRFAMNFHLLFSFFFPPHVFFCLNINSVGNI
jgi:hypothetical protein